MRIGNWLLSALLAAAPAPAKLYHISTGADLKTRLAAAIALIGADSGQVTVESDNSDIFIIDKPYLTFRYLRIRSTAYNDHIFHHKDGEHHLRVYGCIFEGSDDVVFKASLSYGLRAEREGSPVDLGSPGFPGPDPVCSGRVWGIRSLCDGGSAGCFDECGPIRTASGFQICGTRGLHY
jgi:hypothetical protein